MLERRDPPLLILNGFDRCGSSLIGGLLAHHPEVAYLFQPLSGTEVHRTQFEVWDERHRAPVTERFFAGLLRRTVNRAYLGSDWFDRFSTVLNHPGRALWVMKETKLHFKVRWVAAHFPQIELYGLWRDPRGILASLVRNGFHRSWYGPEASAALDRSVEHDRELAAYRPWLGWPRTEVERMAWIVAVRTHWMAQHLAPQHWVVYEDVLEDPNAALEPLLVRYDLAPFDFRPFLHDDCNVIGRPFEGAEHWRSLFSSRQVARIDELFGSLELVRPCVEAMP